MVEIEKKRVSVEVKNDRGRWVTIIVTMEEVLRRDGVPCRVAMRIGDYTLVFHPGGKGVVEIRHLRKNYCVWDSEVGNWVPPVHYRAAVKVAYGIFFPPAHLPVAVTSRPPRSRAKKDAPGQGTLFA